MQLEDLFFDRVAGDEAVGDDRFLAADAVGAVDGLRFDGGVPPGVEQEDVVGVGEVQSEAAGFEADEEKRAGRSRILELLDERLAIRRLAVEVEIRDAFAIEDARARSTGTT